MGRKGRLGVAAVVLIGMLAGLLTACGEDDGPNLDDPSLTSDAPEPVDPEAAVRAEIEQAWNTYWEISAAIPGTYPNPAQWPELLGGVSVDPILRQTLQAVTQSTDAGLVPYGQSVPHIYWPESISADATAARIGDCRDSSGSGSMIAATGEKKTVGPAKNNLRGELVKGPDGKWRVSQIFYLVEEPC